MLLHPLDDLVQAGNAATPRADHFRRRISKFVEKWNRADKAIGVEVSTLAEAWESGQDEEIRSQLSAYPELNLHYFVKQIRLASFQDGTISNPLLLKAAKSLLSSLKQQLDQLRNIPAIGDAEATSTVVQGQANAAGKIENGPMATV